MKSTSFLPTKTHWTDIAVFGLLVTKSFFKCKIDVLIPTLFLQTRLSLFTLHWRESTFHYHINLRLYNTEVFFSIEQIRIVPIFTAGLPQQNKVSKESLSLFEINFSLVRRHDLKPRANSK